MGHGPYMTIEEFSNMIDHAEAKLAAARAELAATHGDSRALLRMRTSLVEKAEAKLVAVKAAMTHHHPEMERGNG